MKDEEIGNRRVIVLDEITNETANKAIRAIVEINIEDNAYRKSIKNFEAEPIKMIINSGGGSVYDGLGIIGAMENSGTAIITICYGSVMSMALFILSAGHHRAISKYSTLMYHEIMSGVHDKIAGIERDLVEAKRLQTMCDGILIKNSKFKKKDLDAYKKVDFYFTPELALEKGLIDEII